MKIEKKKISDLTLCYCVAPLQYRDKPCFLVASEKEYSCLLFDAQGKQVDEVWTQPGGTMTIVQVPDSDGVFLATHKFYSPNNSKEAKIILCRPGESGWQVRTLVELPYVHRFDILSRGGVNYLLACCLKSGYEYKDDWRFPGMTLACPLPENLLDLPADFELKLEPLRRGMLKNHGYSRDVNNGVSSGIVTCDDGVYRFTPPAAPGEQWEIGKLLSAPVSDALLIDFDGDGEKELLTLSPFHGDTLCVYRKNAGVFEKVFEYEKKIEFAHVICPARIDGENMAIVGHRKGDRDLLAVRYGTDGYYVEVLDHDVGPANALFAHVDGKDIILSANREINEIAYYTLSK